MLSVEYASIFSGARREGGSDQPGQRILSFLDDEISDALNYHLRNNGVLVRHNEEFESVKGDDHGVVLSLKSGKKVRAMFSLWAAGNPITWGWTTLTWSRMAGANWRWTSITAPVLRTSMLWAM